MRPLQCTQLRVMIGVTVLATALSLVATALLLISGPVVRAPAAAATLFLLAQPMLWTAVDLLDRASHPRRQPRIEPLVGGNRQRNAA